MTDDTTLSNLDTIWREVASLSERIDPGATLRPVLGGGCIDHPRMAFVFINPTPRNLSTASSWRGPALPFVGVPALWRVLRAAGLAGLDEAADTPGRDWTPALVQRTYDTVNELGLYLTNLVKLTAPNGDAPSVANIRLYEKLLFRELEIVDASSVVTFGQLPFKSLTHRSVRLGDHLDMARAGTFEASPLIGSDVPVYPCYFPTGRGSPQKSAELLAQYAKRL